MGIDALLWRVVMDGDSMGDEWPSRALGSAIISFIKAAHHGSENGVCEGFLEVVADKKSTVAVITPFNHGRKKPPSTEGVSRISKHVRDLYCTNGVVAAKSTGLAWQRPTSINGGNLPVPRAWVSQCAENPLLLTLLDAGESVSPNFVQFSGPFIPREWLFDCQREPRLLWLLRPECGNVRVGAFCDDLTEEFRFSIFYDSSANEINARLDGASAN